MGKRLLASTLLIPVVLVAAACGPQGTYSETHSDSGIRGPSWNQIRGELENLGQTAPGNARYLEYGTTRGSRKLAAVKISSDKIPDSQKKHFIVIAGTIHGDEYLGIEDKLPRWIIEHKNEGGIAEFLGKGGVILVAPILNPDGYEARRRESDAGRDLNRDFDLSVLNHRGFTQQETSGLRNMMNREIGSDGKLLLTMDYHCCADSILYPWGYSFGARLSGKPLDDHKRLSGLMLKQFPTYKAGKSTDILPYEAVGASDDYYHEKFGAMAFTFEGAYQREERNFTAHTRMWQELFADQAKKLPDISTEPTIDGDVVLAVGRETATDAFELAVGTNAGEKVEICRGAASACRAGSAPVLASASRYITSNGRRIFRLTSSLKIEQGTIYTLVARSASGAVISAAAVRIDRK